MFAACDECGYNAATKGMVAKHVQTVHRKEKPFECEICRTRYAVYKFGGLVMMCVDYYNFIYKHKIHQTFIRISKP